MMGSGPGVQLVGVFFARGAGWWWPVDQLEQRVRVLSSATLIRVLRTGVLDAGRNPPALIDRLADELRRRLEAREWAPLSLTEEEIDRWTSIAVPSAARR